MRALAGGLVIALLFANATTVDLAVSRALSLNLTLFDDHARLQPLPSTTRFVASDGRGISSAMNSRWPVKLGDVPLVVQHAVLAAEDSEFYRHGGFDLAALARAAITNALHGRVRLGGSTITEQLAKLNYSRSERTVGRKLRDVVYAARLERHYDKKQLLERYLNQVYFGRHAYGLGAASRAYFGVAPKALTAAQGAMLAGLIRAPSSLDPSLRSGEVRGRRNHVLELMRAHGWLSAADAALASSSALGVLRDYSAEVQPFLDYVTREATELRVLGPTKAARRARLERADLTIETTLDLDLLGRTAAAVNRIVGPGDPALAFAAIAPGDGAVRALYQEANEHGSPAVAGEFGRGGGASSALIAYVAALQYGAPTDADVPVSGRHLPLDAALSLAPASLMDFVHARLGAESIHLTAAQLGFDAVSRRSGIPAVVTPLQYAAAIATIRAGGRYAAPYAIRRIVDARGRTIYERSADTTQVLSPAQATRARAAMRPRADDSLSVLAGTTPGATDGWLLGTTPKLAFATWIGIPDCTVATPAIAATEGLDARFTSFLREALHVAPGNLDLPPELPPPAMPDTAPAAATVDELRTQIRRSLARAHATKVAVGVDVDGLGNVVDVNTRVAMPPASTTKLFTAGAALEKLGPNFRFRTELRSNARPTDGTLPGDLILTGGGDPTLTTGGLRHLARNLAQMGVARIDGDLLVDDTRYDHARAASGWERSDVPVNAGPLSAFTVQGNRWRCDAQYVREPALDNGTLFAHHLARAGVSLRGTVRVGHSDAARLVLAYEESKPLRVIVTDMLKRSDNGIAELLLKELGYRQRTPTTRGGAHVVREVLRTAGVSPTIADGSGLSRFDRAQAVDELAWLNRSQRAIEASLPIACVDGTLRDRMCTPGTMGRVRAKTGTGARTVALAGYTTTSSGRRVRFVFMLSGVRNVLDAQKAVDGAVVAIAGART